MTRLDRLVALAQRTGLLAPGQDDDQRLANAVAFTNLAAWELREEGFAAIKSTDPKDEHGIKAGFIANRSTGEHFRIISNLDTPNQVVVMEELAPLSVRTEFARPGGPHVELAAPTDPSTSPALQGALAGAMSKSASPKSSKKNDHATA